ncbi:MAG: FMN-binding negative transcriptional regulator [Pirellulales bacterium]|nr:FMN-binding negative transcriptional regulator [Pirellulales bacterium]
MYVPSHFTQTDPGTLQVFVRTHSFATLVSAGDDEVPLASHLPLLIDEPLGEQGALVGHLARANPHWPALDGRTTLAIFHGPHAYISPTRYGNTSTPDGARHVVPTWNYTAVHVYGTCHLEHDPAVILAILEHYVEFYERGQPTPWRFHADTPFARRLAAQVVAFRIDIARWEGTWKLGQNHAAERRARTAAALDDPQARAIAELMQATLSSQQRAARRT